MSRTDKLSVRLIDSESGIDITNPIIWKKLQLFLIGKTNYKEFNREVELFVFEDILKESDLDAESFYHQHRDTIKNDIGKKAIFLKYFGIASFNKFKRSIKEEYPDIFYDTNFRLSIVEEQNYICAICGANLKDINAHLHHINYDKQNCRKDNLVFLCPRCHGKTNYERSFWKGILQEYKETHETITDT